MYNLKEKKESVNSTAEFLTRLPEKVRNFLKEQGVEDSPLAPARPGNRRQTKLLDREKRRRQVERFVPKKQRRARMIARARARELNYLKKLRNRYPLGPAPRPIPIRVWTMSGDILADASGRAAESYLSGCGNKPAVTLIRNAAQAIDEQTGEVRRELSSERSRRIVALGLSMAALGDSTRRKGRWRQIVKGIPQSAFLALLRNPHTGERPGLSALNGIHAPNPTLESGQLGYLRMLEKSGFCYSQQLPVSEVTPNEAMGQHALNRYWIVGPFSYTPKIDAVTIENLALLEAAQELGIFPAFACMPYAKKDEIKPDQNPGARGS